MKINFLGHKILTGRHLEDAAYKLAEAAHRGQFRHDGKTPFIEHPRRVGEALRKAGASSKVVAAAFLHDVLEDTNVDTQILIQHGMPMRVRELVYLLTKKNYVTYEFYLYTIKADKDAIKIKVADMLDNLTDAPTKKAVKKYGEGLGYLLL